MEIYNQNTLSPEDVLHLLFKRHSSEEIIERLNDIRNALDDEESFKDLLKSRNRQLRNMFHLAAENRNINFGEILPFVRTHLEDQEFGEMLIICDEDGDNVLHSLFKRNSSEEIIERLNEFKNALDDKYLFKNLLKSKNRKLMNMFHLAAESRYINFVEILGFVCEYLGKHEIVEMLFSGDEDGDNVLHSLFERNSSEEIIEGLNVIKNALDDEESFKNLLKSKNRKLMNMFHLAAEKRYINFGEILGFGCENLEKHEFVEMLISCDEDGDNVLHSLFKRNSSEEIIERLNDIKNALDDTESFKNLLKRRNRQLRNMFHLAAVNRYRMRFDFLNFYLSDDEIRELLIERDQYGRTFLHRGSIFHANNFLLLLNYSLKKLSTFEDLILAVDEDGESFLHSFVQWYSDNNAEQLVIDIFKFLKKNVSVDNFNTLLGIRNVKGKTFLEVQSWHRAEYIENIIEFFERILQESL